MPTAASTWITRICKFFGFWHILYKIDTWAHNTHPKVGIIGGCRLKGECVLWVYRSELGNSKWCKTCIFTWISCFARLRVKSCRRPHSLLGLQWGPIGPGVQLTSGWHSHIQLDSSGWIDLARYIQPGIASYIWLGIGGNIWLSIAGIQSGIWSGHS